MNTINQIALFLSLLEAISRQIERLIAHAKQTKEASDEELDALAARHREIMEQSAHWRV